MCIYIYRNTSVWVNGLGITPYPIIQYTPESTNIEAKNRCFEFNVVFPFFRPSDIFVGRVVLALSPDLRTSAARFQEEFQGWSLNKETLRPWWRTHPSNIWRYIPGMRALFRAKKRWAILLPIHHFGIWQSSNRHLSPRKGRDTWQHWHPNSHHWKGTSFGVSLKWITSS